MGEETVKIAVNPEIQVGGSLLTPEHMALIASLVGRDAKIEMTPFKQLYVEVPLAKRERITEELQRAGLEVYPAGFVVKSLIACNFCKGAEDAGLDAAIELNRAVAGMETPTPIKVAYAGCALGTSEPLLKDIGVVKMRDTYDVYVGGEPKGIKSAVAKLLVAGLEKEQLIPFVTRIIQFYKENAKGKEKFSKFVERMSLAALQQEISG